MAGLGKLYRDKDAVLKHREWRGFRDTMYDFYRWLVNWKDILKFVFRQPNGSDDRLHRRSRTPGCLPSILHWQILILRQILPILLAHPPGKSLIIIRWRTYES